MVEILFLSEEQLLLSQLAEAVTHLLPLPSVRRMMVVVFQHTRLELKNSFFIFAYIEFGSCQFYRGLVPLSGKLRLQGQLTSQHCTNIGIDRS